MIRAELNPMDEKRLAEKQPKMMLALQARLNRLLLELQAKIVGEKLQGEVLQHRSGKLGKSIVIDPANGAMIVGNEVIGSVIGATPPAGYGAVHERGGKAEYEIVPVSRKVLMFYASGGAKRFAKRVMHPPLKQRSFMASSLLEMRDRIVAGLKEAAVEGMAS